LVQPANRQRPPGAAAAAAATTSREAAPRPGDALPAAEAVLEARRVTKAFGGMRAVDAFSIALGRGEILGVIGPNGAGKTTLFNLIAGTLRTDAGDIIVNGASVAGEGPWRRIGHGLGRSFQIPRPFPRMTVLENVMTAAQRQAGERSGEPRARRAGWRQRSAPPWPARGEFCSTSVSLTHLADQPAGVLSGGQRKLLELARVLMAEPR
jgi:branched-chain amino acid transport system ATP-binding protein